MQAEPIVIAPPESPAVVARWRFNAGVVLFALALLPVGIVLPVIFRHLPLKTVGTLVGASLILQKVLLLGAVMLLGKPGFTLLKAKLFHKLTPPAEVGPVRYRIGLIMFCLPFLYRFLETVLSHAVPHLVRNRLWADVVMDVMLVASLFVLGGNFWDKLRALFTAEARAVFPADVRTTDFAPPDSLDLRQPPSLKL